jgi:hypothetical protein
MERANEKNTRGDNKSAGKKPYLSPKLTDFGTVTQLTQTNNKRITLDGIGTMMGDGPMSMAS